MFNSSLSKLQVRYERFTFYGPRQSDKVADTGQPHNFFDLIQAELHFFSKNRY